MNVRFAACVHELEPKFAALLQANPFKICNTPTNIPKSGIYLFSENTTHLYVGRSANIRNRLKNHCHGHENTAAFAFLLARQKTGNLTPSYRKEGSRSELMTQPLFKEAFFSAIERIKRMDVRVVEEPDPIRQTLLELYVSIAVGTPHNSFKTT